MYGAVDDPYCYADTSVLRNRLGLRDQAALDAFEADAVQQRGEEPLPGGSLSVAHYRAVHRHLFRDVYRWAGRFRTVRISKPGSMFCYPERIPAEMDRVFSELQRAGFLRGLGRGDFVTGAAGFIADLNAIHPFREGNGRAQMVFLALVASRAGHPLRLERIDGPRFLAAMVAGFHGDVSVLEAQLASIT